MTIKTFNCRTMVSSLAIAVSLLAHPYAQATDRVEENAPALYPRVQCLWRLEAPVYRQAALELLDQAAQGGDPRAAVRFLKKLGANWGRLRRF